MRVSSATSAVALLASVSSSSAQSPYSIENDGKNSTPKITTTEPSITNFFPLEAIKKTAAQLAWDMLQYYHGNESGGIPGILPGPPPAGDYYWWEGGAMWGTLMDYWKCTGDKSHNDLVMDGMMFQDRSRSGLPASQRYNVSGQ